MKADYLFLLAAGKGTRMGELGTVIPKPLFPIGQSTLLQLQAYLMGDFVKENRNSQIFVNTHHLHKMIAEKKLFNIVFEEKILGSGGCLSHLKVKKQIHEIVLVANTDHFFDLEQNIIDEGLLKIQKKDCDVILFAYKIDPCAEYNRILVSDSGEFQGIEKFSRHQKMSSSYTFSGISLFNFNKIIPLYSDEQGDFVEEGLFDLIERCQLKVKIINLPDIRENYDLGTWTNYQEMHRLIYQRSLINKASFAQRIQDFCHLNQFIKKVISEKSHEHFEVSYPLGPDKEEIQFHFKF